jgi:hypothetical protein
MELGRKMIEDTKARMPQTKPEDRNLVDDIMAAHIETPEKMPESDLIVSLTGPYVAGLDTVANTTAAVVYCVLKHPEVKARVLKEVDELFAAGDLDEGGPAQEAARTQRRNHGNDAPVPIAVAQMRTANKDFVFEGHQIYEGEMIYVGTSVPHFMEEYWPRARTSTSTVIRSHAPSICSPACTHLTAAARTPAWARAWPRCRWHCRWPVCSTRLDLELESPDYVLKTKTAPTPGPAMSFKVRVKGYRH